MYGFVPELQFRTPAWDACGSARFCLTILAQTGDVSEDQLDYRLPSSIMSRERRAVRKPRGKIRRAELARFVEDHDRSVWSYNSSRHPAKDITKSLLPPYRMRRTG